MNLSDGQRVSFVGTPAHGGVQIGDTGQVLSRAGESAHVMWHTGSKRGEVTFEDIEDLVGQGHTAAAVEEATTDEGLSTIAVRDVYDANGDVGVLNAMADAGHLATMQPYAEEALTLVEGRLRTDPSFKAVTAQLEPDEADRLVSLAAAVLMRDAFGASE